jgi:hypothetical protein
MAPGLFMRGHGGRGGGAAEANNRGRMGIARDIADLLAAWQGEDAAAHRTPEAVALQIIERVCPHCPTAVALTDMTAYAKCQHDAANAAQKSQSRGAP